MPISSYFSLLSSSFGFIISISSFSSSMLFFFFVDVDDYISRTMSYIITDKAKNKKK